MKNIVLIGYDPEIIELVNHLENFNVKGYVDLKPVNNDFYGLDYLGNDNGFIERNSTSINYELLITLDDPILRNRLYSLYKANNFKFATIISNSASISENCYIGEGCIIQSGVNISHGVSLDNNVKINVGANLMHDVHIKLHTTVAPNSVLLGYVEIGESCFIGANSTILPKCIISENTTIGAGSVVTKDLSKGIYVGVPARRLSNEK